MAEESNEPKEKEESPSAPPPKEGAEGTPAPQATGTLPMPVFLGIIGGGVLGSLLIVVAIGYFILPGRIAESLSSKSQAPAQEVHPAEASPEKEKKEEAHGKKEETKGKKEEKKEEAHGKKEEAKGKKEEAKGKKEEGKEKKEDAHGKKEEGGAHGEGGEEAAPEEVVETKIEDFILSEIVVNVAGTRGNRYVKASLFFDAPEPVRVELESKRAKVIDIVSQVLGSKTIDDLTSENSRGLLRANILKSVNALLGEEKVQNIYFLDLIVQ